MKYVIDARKEIFRTNEYVIEDGFIKFKDKFGAEIVLNMMDVRKIRETKDDIQRD